MTNILIEAEEFLLSTTHEVYKKFKNIADKYPCSVRLTSQRSINAEDFDWCDIVISIRSFSDFDVRLAKLAHTKGKKFCLYLDDDLLGLPSNYGRYSVGVWPKRKKALEKILGYTDILLTCNPLLGKKYSELGCGIKYVVVDAAVRNEDVHIRADVRSNEKVKIVYYVNDGTSRHFERIIRPILPKLAEEFGEKIALYLMTVRPDLHEFESKMEIHYIKHMDYDKFKQFMYDERFDIGISPLIAGGFSQFKYFNKYMEYSRYGIAGIYSSCEPYTFVVRDGVDGILCGDASQRWYEAICKLITEPETRHVIVANAQRRLLEKFSIDNITDKLAAECPILVSYTAPQSKSSFEIVVLHILRRIDIFKECLYFSRMALASGGPKLFCVRVVRYLRRVLTQRKKEKKYV